MKKRKSTNWLTKRERERERNGQLKGAGYEAIGIEYGCVCVQVNMESSKKQCILTDDALKPIFPFMTVIYDFVVYGSCSILNLIASLRYSFTLNWCSAGLSETHLQDLYAQKRVWVNGTELK